MQRGSGRSARGLWGRRTRTWGRCSPRLGGEEGFTLARLKKEAELNFKKEEELHEPRGRQEELTAVRRVGGRSARGLLGVGRLTRPSLFFGPLSLLISFHHRAVASIILVFIAILHLLLVLRDTEREVINSTQWIEAKKLFKMH